MVEGGLPDYSRVHLAQLLALAQLLEWVPGEALAAGEQGRWLLRRAHPHLDCRLFSPIALSRFAGRIPQNFDNDPFFWNCLKPPTNTAKSLQDSQGLRENGVDQWGAAFAGDLTNGKGREALKARWRVRGCCRLLATVM